MAKICAKVNLRRWLSTPSVLGGGPSTTGCGCPIAPWEQKKDMLLKLAYFVSKYKLSREDVFNMDKTACHLFPEPGVYNGAIVPFANTKKQEREEEGQQSSDKIVLILDC